MLVKARQARRHLLQHFVQHFGLCFAWLGRQCCLSPLTSLPSCPCLPCCSLLFLAAPLCFNSGYFSPSFFCKLLLAAFAASACQIFQLNALSANCSCCCYSRYCYCCCCCCSACCCCSCCYCCFLCWIELQRFLVVLFAIACARQLSCCCCCSSWCCCRAVAGQSVMAYTQYVLINTLIAICAALSLATIKHLKRAQKVVIVLWSCPILTHFSM